MKNLEQETQNVRIFERAFSRRGEKGCTEVGRDTQGTGEREEADTGRRAQEVLRSALVRGHTLLFLWVVHLGCYQLLSTTL